MTISNEQLARPQDAGRSLDPKHPGTAARYKLNDLYCSVWIALTTSALAKARVFDFIEDSPTAVESIAAKADLSPPALYRALRALAANEILIEIESEKFAHTEISKLLRSESPESWSGMSQMWGHPVALRSWEKFGEALKDGKSGISHAFGKPLYEYLHTDPDATRAFSDAMISNSAHAAKAISNAFPFTQFKTIADLGGGVGTLLAEILECHPTSRGVLYEIADLEQGAKEYIAARGLHQRCEVVIGDFLNDAPANVDLYLVKNSLWNWDDERCLQILKNVRAAIGKSPEKRLLIIEYIIGKENARWTTAYDLQILNLPGGRARTQTEYEALFQQSLFALELVAQAEDQTILVAKPV